MLGLRWGLGSCEKKGGALSVQPELSVRVKVRPEGSVPGIRWWWLPQRAWQLSLKSTPPKKKCQLNRIHQIQLLMLSRNTTEKAMATHSSTLAWKISWTEEPGGLQSMGSWRVGHNWVTSLSLFTFMHWRRKWPPTPAFLPGESQGRGSLVGCRLWGRRVRHDWSDLAAAAAETQRASQVVLVVKNPPANARDIRDTGLIPGMERSPGGGHGNPLQYSCLENPPGRLQAMGSQGVRHNWSNLAHSTHRNTKLYVLGESSLSSVSTFPTLRPHKLPAPCGGGPCLQRASAGFHEQQVPSIQTFKLRTFKAGNVPLCVSCCAGPLYFPRYCKIKKCFICSICLLCIICVKSIINLVQCYVLHSQLC